MLHMICGKAGSGKSTLAKRLAEETGALLISQDAWMAALYPDELVEIADYIRLIPRLSAAMGPHVTELLRAGLTVVLDWPANTARTRAWMRGVADAAGAGHRLHLLDVPDAVCLARVQGRNAAGEHEFTLSEAQFAEITRYFEPPTDAEGLNTIVHALT
jgi:predicted kinase